MHQHNTANKVYDTFFNTNITKSAVGVLRDSVFGGESNDIPRTCYYVRTVW